MIALNPLNDQTKPKQRESQFELIRILAQLFIVLYHLFMLYVYPTTGQHLHKAIWLPLHIGVPLFVMISGYFGIRPSVKGFVKLAGMVFVLYVPLELTDYLMFTGGGKRRLIGIIDFLFGSHFWFIRTYIYLYLFSPVVNKYLKGITRVCRWYLIGILSLMSIYIGNIMEFDPSFPDGKHIVNFILLYVIGDTLKYYKKKWEYWNWRSLMAIWLVWNGVLVVMFSYVNPDGPIFGALFTRIFFSYASPGLILSTILFFIIVGGITFHSKFINTMAKSSLAIYMLHCSMLLRRITYMPIAMRITTEYSDNQAMLFISLFLLSILIIAVCVLVDNLLSPVWSFINRLGIYCQNLVNDKWLSRNTS